MRSDLHPNSRIFSLASYEINLAINQVPEVNIQSSRCLGVHCAGVTDPEDTDVDVTND